MNTLGQYPNILSLEHPMSAKVVDIDIKYLDILSLETSNVSKSCGYRHKVFERIIRL
ncbi:hypothetical protein AGMMS49936_11360 [Endomicrobiia bacterium]|nr:hypothetical protein AGMMS49936_11360 [Endomicrobiia bacterium]